MDLFAWRGTDRHRRQCYEISTVPQNDQVTEMAVITEPGLLLVFPPFAFISPRSSVSEPAAFSEYLWYGMCYFVPTLVRNNENCVLIRLGDGKQPHSHGWLQQGRVHV